MIYSSRVLTQLHAFTSGIEGSAYDTEGNVYEEWRRCVPLELHLHIDT